MTLSSRHRIRNSSPGGLRPSTLPLGHGGSPQYWLSHVDGEETFLFLSTEPRTLAWKAAVLTTTLWPPPTGRPVDEISEFLLFTVTNGGHFRFYALENSARFFKRGVVAYFFTNTLSYLKQPSNLQKVGHWIMVLNPTNRSINYTESISLTITPKALNVFMKIMETKELFSIWNHHKCVIYLFPIHSNSYVLNLLPLEIFQPFQCGDWL